MTALRSTMDVVAADLGPIPDPPPHMPICDDETYCCPGEVDCGAKFECQRPAGHPGAHQHVLTWRTSA